MIVAIRPRPIKYETMLIKFSPSSTTKLGLVQTKIKTGRPINKYHLIYLQTKQSFWLAIVSTS